MVIIDHGLQTLTHEVIVPHSGWEREPNEDFKPRDAEWTTVFKNTSGCLRCGQQPLLGSLPPVCLGALLLKDAGGNTKASVHTWPHPWGCHVPRVQDVT